MTEFTYQLPDEEEFLYSLRSFLEAKRKNKIAGLLACTSCNIDKTKEFSNKRWNAYATKFVLYASISRMPEFTEDVLQQIWNAVELVFPPEAGFDIIKFSIEPFSEENPSVIDEPINLAKAIDGSIIPYDGLNFRSKAEIHIYDELKKRNILFFPNATVVLGKKNRKLEPDFLVCQEGKWGVLEVMGKDYHGATAVRDHERARTFKDYGLLFIEFYDARECYQQPEKVVDDFLNRLHKS